jgi:hypothetical protein
MTKSRIVLAAAVVLGGLFASAAQGRELTCNHTADEYKAAVAHFELQVAKARAQADQNPLYLADLGYYESVLTSAKQCARSVGPMTTASR